jgi:prevent-host-death family protein
MKTSVTTIGAFEAKNTFSELIERVSRGAEITITKHDRPVAKIVPVSDDLASARLRATADLRTLREHYSLAGLSVHELVADGRA